MTVGVRSILATESFDPFVALRDFAAEAQGMGAIASFVGTTRGTSKAGDSVMGLFLDHHDRLTLHSVERIVADARRRFDVPHLLAIHRIGSVAAGEPIVLTAAASLHRRAAFQAVDYMMDRLKTDALFWKREDRTDGTGVWIEPTGQDHEERQRWDTD